MEQVVKLRKSSFKRYIEKIDERRSPKNRRKR